MPCHRNDRDPGGISWGVGCGWAFQSAEWLVDSTAEAVRQGADLAPHLCRYGRMHRRRLAGHACVVCDYSRVRNFSPIERLVYAAAVHDPPPRCTSTRSGRHIGVSRFLAPRPLARAARVLATRRRGIGEMRPSGPD